MGIIHMSGKAIVLWMTGMSGSGKSTIAGILTESLRSNGMKPLALDGDHVRERLHTHLSFTEEDILENNRLVAELCAESLFDYDAILVPIISPYAQGRRRAREIVGDSFFKFCYPKSLRYSNKIGVSTLVITLIEITVIIT